MTRIGTERRCVCGEWLLWAPPNLKPGGLPMHDGRRPAMAALADAMGRWEERERWGTAHVCPLAGVVEALSAPTEEPHAADYVPPRGRQDGERDPQGARPGAGGSGRRPHLEAPASAPTRPPVDGRSAPWKARDPKSLQGGVDA